MEKNFLSLIKTRRSVRAYKSEPVPSKALDAVLEAGTYAPTGGGHQSPTIIAITDPKYRREIAKLNAEVMGEQHRPLLWRTCRDPGFGRWLRKYLCGGRKLRPRKHDARRPCPWAGNCMGTSGT